MPCNSEYMNPTGKEIALQQTAKLLVYVQKKLGKTPDTALLIAANDSYCTADYVPDLCAILKHMGTKQRENIVYNAHDKTARQLADWLEEHEEADRKRIADERADAQKKRLAKQALSKLSRKEREALEV